MLLKFKHGLKYVYLSFETTPAEVLTTAVNQLWFGGSLLWRFRNSHIVVKGVSSSPFSRKEAIQWQGKLAGVKLNNIASLHVIICTFCTYYTENKVKWTRDFKVAPAVITSPFCNPPLINLETVTYPKKITVWKLFNFVPENGPCLRHMDVSLIIAHCYFNSVCFSLHCTCTLYLNNCHNTCTLQAPYLYIVFRVHVHKLNISCTLHLHVE